MNQHAEHIEAERHREQLEYEAMKSARAKDFRENSGIDAIYADASLDSLLATGGKLHGAKYVQPVKRFLTRIRTPGVFAIIGHRDAGKSNLVSAIINAFCDRDRDARYIRAVDFFLRVKATMSRASNETAQDVVEELCNVNLLVIDAIQARGGGAFEDSLLTHIVDKRYAGQKWTILVSNHTLEAFSQHIGEDISARLNRGGGVLVCDWPPFRKSSGGT